MKNVSRPLISGYYNLLNGMVVEGKTVPFFHLKAPYPFQPPYILLTTLFSANNNTYDSFDCETTVDLMVYTEFEGDYGSMDLADAIAEEILKRVIPMPGTTNVQADGFTVAGARLRGMRDFNDVNNEKSTFSKRLTFEHLIYQL
jgi:hypothetical protein